MIEVFAPSCLIAAENQILVNKARALLIGIDTYPGLDAAYRLEGSLADVEAMRRYLVDCLDLAPIRIEQRLEEEATRQGILQALEKLHAEVEAGELVVIHYSGHGSRLPATKTRKGSAFEETIVPYDGRLTEAAPRDIRGSELRAKLAPIARKTRRLVLIFDCCHAGTLVRDPLAARVRALPPPKADDTVGRVEDVKPMASADLDASLIFVGACRRDEKAHEICVCEEPLSFAGALTYHLLRHLRSAPEGATWRDVMEDVELGLMAELPGQHPQLEGEADRILFELSERRPEPYLRVAAVDRERRRATLDGGWFQGVHNGSRWKVIPAKPGPGDCGEKDLLEVTSVRSASCDAVWPAESLTEPKVGNRVFLVEPGPHQVCRGIRIVQYGPPCARMERFHRRLSLAIEENPLLRNANDATAEVTVHLVPTDFTGPLAFLPKSIDRKDPGGVWVANRSGELAMPRHHWDDPFAVIDVVSNLVAGVRWQHLAALRSSAPAVFSGGDDWRVQCRIFRWSGTGWIDVEAESGRSHHFEVEDRFGLKIRHASREPLHVYVLQLSPDGEIRLVFPRPGAFQPIEPGQQVRFGFEETEAQIFVLDPRFPFDAPRAAVTVEERFEIIVTPEPTDFRPLFQGRLRRGAGLDQQYLGSPLGRFLRLVYSGWREEAPLEESRSSRWEIKTLIVRVRRPEAVTSEARA